MFRLDVSIDTASILAQRSALSDLYVSTNGDNWRMKTNWTSTAELSYWYGVTTDEAGNVATLTLNSNYLKGSNSSMLMKLC